MRVVVLTSSHEKVFSAGGNLGGFAADAPTAHKYLGTAALPVDVFSELGELGKPSIVAANGHVLAGALGIALACDLIVAKDTAGFGTPEINVGLFPFMIMALIYRNVAAQEDDRDAAARRAADRRGGARGGDRQQGRRRPRSSTPRSPSGRRSWPRSRRW